MIEGLWSRRLALYLVCLSNSICCIGMAVKPTVIKVGIYANTFSSNGSLQQDGAQSLAAFMMAVKEINANDALLSGCRLAVAHRSGVGPYAATSAAQAFISANFTIDGHGNKISSTAFNSGNPMGVDVIVGTGTTAETDQLDQVLNHFGIVQVHTVSNTINRVVRAQYPYRIGISPTVAYDGAVYQEIICNHFKLRKVAVISTDYISDLSTVEDLSDGKYCQIDLLLAQSLPSDTTDFQSTIEEVSATGALIIVLFMPDMMAANFLEQAYDSGFLVGDIQIFGNTLVTGNSLWTHFKNQASTVNIMKGYIGIKYSPKYALHSTEKGQSFVERFRHQHSTAKYKVDGSFVCNNSTDDTGSYLYQEQISRNSASICSGLNLTSFHANGSDMYSYAAHAYDAAYAVAEAIETVLNIGSNGVINGDTIHSAFISNVSFIGATGKVAFIDDRKELLSLSTGDREAGLTYLIYNFNGDLYQSTNGSIGLAVVGKWALESGGVTLCSADTASLIGNDCVGTVYYRSALNTPPCDTRPDVYLNLPDQIRASLISLGASVLVIVVISLSLTTYYRKGKLIRSSQPYLLDMVHFGCFIAGLRIVFGGLPISNATCGSTFFLGHLSFFAIYIPLLAKVFRLHQIFANKSLKPLNLPWKLVYNVTTIILGVISLYLTIAVIFGRPIEHSLIVTAANQTFFIVDCETQHSEYSAAIFALEGAIVAFSIVLLHKIKKIPDRSNEMRFITAGKIISFFIVL